jgi:KamA family protein
MKFYGLRDLDKIPHFQNLPEELKFESKVVAHVLPFRTNNYVVEELIDWNNIPNDPMFQLTFMQRDMLRPENFEKIANVVRKEKSREEINKIVNEIRMDLNPHPAGQMTANVPRLANDEPIQGIQHKYRETCLVFPSEGQTCHAYCTFCFRWAQFVGNNDLKFATCESRKFQKYLRNHEEITDVLFTGGDPMIMSLQRLKTYIEPLLSPEFAHIQNIRIGTKSLSYWPYKYVTDKEADELLFFMEKIVKSGKHLAFMAHFNHWVESSTDIVHEAVERIRSTGAEIRTQSPLIKHINDDADVWARMWKDQVHLGMIPYYMFVERDTGAKRYFAVPLARAFEVFKDAYKSVSGLSRSVRGPSMSALPGKVVVEGVTEIKGEKVFMLNFIQARNPEWVRNPFFAEYDENASWLDKLTPAFGADKFFYEDELKAIINDRSKLEEEMWMLREDMSEVSAS